MSELLNYLNKLDSIDKIENWVYESTELESLVSANQYQLLLEFNYKGKDSNKKFENLIRRKILSEQEFQLWKLNKVLIKSGWYKGREFKSHKINSGFYSKKALEILKEYGGLKINQTNDVFRDIEFLDELVHFDKDYVKFGMTENTYVSLLINSKNEFHYSFDITEEYRYAGDCLKYVLVKLLFAQDPW